MVGNMSYITIALDWDYTVLLVVAVHILEQTFWYWVDIAYYLHYRE